MRLSLTILIFILISLQLQAQSIIKLGKNEVYDFCFSPKGYLAYAANGNTITIWNIQTRTVAGNLKNGSSNSIISLDISNDSAFIAASTIDSMLIIWDLKSNAILKNVKLESIANKVIFDNNSKSLFLGLRNGDLLSFKFENGEILTNHKSGLTQISAMASLESEGIVAIGDQYGNLQIWNSKTFTIINQQKAHSNMIRGLAFGFEGWRLYSCSDDGSVICFNVKDKQLAKDSYTKHGILNSWIMSVDFLSPKFTAFATYEGKITIKSYDTEYAYKSQDHVYKIHFLPNKNNSIILGLGTSNGIQIIRASDMKFIQ